MPTQSETEAELMAECDPLNDAVLTDILLCVKKSGLGLILLTALVVLGYALPTVL